MSGRDAAPAERRRTTGAVVGNLLSVAFVLYLLNPNVRQRVDYAALHASQWLAWGAERAWRGARRWWRLTSPWYQEILEQERPLP